MSWRPRQAAFQGRWEDARADFGARMREAVDAGRLARGWAQTIAMIGSYERVSA